MQEIESYLSDLELYHRSQLTITNVRCTLCNFADGRNVLKVCPDNIKTWLRSMNGTAIQSQIKYLQYISSFYDYLIEEGKYKGKNPCKKVLKELRKAPTNRRRETTILSVDDVRRIVLKASNPRDRSICLLLYKTGMRLRELAQLRLEDIDLEDIPKAKKDYGKIIQYGI